MRSIVEVYTDGSSRGNPGPGGWGVVIYTPEERIELSDKVDHTTNNEMELYALYHALKFVKEEFEKCSITVYTDSTYVCNGFNKWMERWSKNNWTTCRGACQHVKLWKKILVLKQGLKVNVVWIKGHSGIEGNEIADRLARD